MKTHIYIILATYFALIPALAIADDIRLANGRVLRNVTVNRILDDGIMVTPPGFAANTTKYHWRFLHPEDAARFKAAGAKPTKDEDLQNAPDGLNIVIIGKVLSVTKDGVLLTDATFGLRVMKDVVTYTNPLDGSKRYGKEPGIDAVTSKEPVFVYGVAGLVDGDKYSGRVCTAPSYVYSAVSGASKTVRAFATSIQLSKTPSELPE